MVDTFFCFAGGFSKFTKPGYEIIRSHPTLPVLACVSSNQQVLLFDETSGNLIRTFSYGRKDKDQPASCKRSKKVTQMGWNVSNFFEIYTALIISCVKIIRSMGQNWQQVSQMVTSLCGNIRVARFSLKRRAIGNQ